MERTVEITAARLHERAAHCRDLARHAVSEGVATELESIADDYDRDAERLESRRTPS
ncbi:MAG TPA: hypothetical protein VMH36_11500 [Alphaproteobacteria bacterium]|nr:hypothetical protein [Alphaproteobacteria bacterium]